MKFFSFLVLFFLLVAFACTKTNKSPKVVVCKEGINLLPMYGRVEKCQEQIESDQEFLKTYDDEGKDRSKISLEYVDTAWYYLHQEDYNTAMKRLNQAWLLDSTNLLIYASYVCLLDINKKPDEAIQMMQLTFAKLKQRDEQVALNGIDNDAIMELITSDVPFAYKKTQNLKVARFLYQSLDTLKIEDVDNNDLLSILDEEMPALEL